MKIISSSRKMQELSRRIQVGNKTIGFVPTMGYLHQGHLSLVRQARKETDVVVMSIFVNPIQFGPKEDFKRYPRDLKRDIRLARENRVDVIFHPRGHDMYPESFRTYLNVEGLGNVLCGRSRPGHFSGVATVVAKLFNIVRPDTAYFGQKDAQQATIIKKMVKDLNFPLKIKVLKIVRERDGLAMSSRNTYLSQSERADALVLNRALKLARKLIKHGQRDPRYLIRRMKSLIRTKESARIEYVKIVDLEKLSPLKKISRRSLIALAVWIGKVRLIDNIIIG